MNSKNETKKNCLPKILQNSTLQRFLTSVSLQHEPKASDVITLVKKTFFARVSYEILYHEVWKRGFPQNRIYAHGVK